MTTTAVFAEMLVAGIEAAVWMVLLALAIAQPHKSDLSRLASFKDFGALVATFVLALSYGLGIVIDRVADSIFEKIFGKANKAQALMRLQVLGRGDKVTDFLEYIRTRIRVARSTTLNFALTSVAAPLFLVRCTEASRDQILMTALVLAGLTIMGAFTAARIGKTYDERLKQAAAMRFRKHS